MSYFILMILLTLSKFIKWICGIKVGKDVIVNVWIKKETLQELEMKTEEIEDAIKSKIPCKCM